MGRMSFVNYEEFHLESEAFSKLPSFGIAKSPWTSSGATVKTAGCDQTA